MDFVEGLGDTTNTLEVPVDRIGRVEIYCDRVRVTLARASVQNDAIIIQPAVCIVWTVAAWRSCHADFAEMHRLVTEGRATLCEIEGVGVRPH